MKKQIECPNCHKTLNLPIDKCSDCGYVFSFQKLQPVIPVEVVEPIEAVVPLDYDPKAKKVEETNEIPTVIFYDEEEPKKEAKTKQQDKTSLSPIVAIYDETTPAESKKAESKPRKITKQPIDYEQINHEKRLSFSFIFILTLSILLIMDFEVPLTSIIYELTDPSKTPIEIYDIISFINLFSIILLIAYYILIGALSINKNKRKRITAIALTIVSIIMHLGFMLALQFIRLSAGIPNYITLITLILWVIIQITLLNIKREE